MSDERCETCRFWRFDIEATQDSQVDREKYGFCRRYPRQLFLYKKLWPSEELAWRHPVECEDGWCGEYQPLGVREKLPVPTGEYTRHLSVKASKTCYRLGLDPYTAAGREKLATLTDEDILLVRNTGPTTLLEIKDFLRDYGLGLRRPTPAPAAPSPAPTAPR